MRPRSLPRLWLCADLTHPNAPSLHKRVASVLAATPATVWLRAAREVSSAVLYAHAHTLAAMVARARGSALLVGDRVDVALAVGAAGVHLPSHALPPEVVRGLTDGALSAATHHDDDVRAHAPWVDVLLVSPFGMVEGKAPALGVDGLRRLCVLAGERPVVALGGIIHEVHVRDAIACGAAGVAVRRALLDDARPDVACRTLAAALPRGNIDLAPLQ